MRSFRFHPDAAEEAAAAAEYYDSKRPGLGSEFVADFDECITTACEFPESGTPYESSTRRLLLRRFPFALVYLTHPDGIEVIAAAHERREPGYWRMRIR